jgi:glycosyltransferase involved in cell wall biosynthesis
MLMERHLSSSISKLLWRAKGRWVKNSVKRADWVTVQTRVFADQVIAETGADADKIAVIPHGPGLVEMGSERVYPDTDVWKIGCITKFGIQKNFGTVFDAISVIRKKQNVSLVLSLDETAVEYPAVQRMIEKAGIADIVVNHGEVGEQGIQKLFDGLDIFVFSSLCESFGFPLLEAMARGLPIVAADIPSTVEIGGDAILKFDPMDSEALAAELDRLLADKAAYELHSQLSLDRAKQFLWSKSAVRTVALMEQVAASSR